MRLAKHSFQQLMSGLSEAEQLKILNSFISHVGLNDALEGFMTATGIKTPAVGMGFKDAWVSIAVSAIQKSNHHGFDKTPTDFDRWLKESSYLPALELAFFNHGVVWDTLNLLESWLIEYVRAVEGKSSDLVEVIQTYFSQDLPDNIEPEGMHILPSADINSGTFMFWEDTDDGEGYLEWEEGDMGVLDLAWDSVKDAYSTLGQLQLLSDKFEDNKGIKLKASYNLNV